MNDFENQTINYFDADELLPSDVNQEIYGAVTTESVQALKQAILSTGQITPVGIYLKDDKKILVDGHRRCKAVLDLYAEGLRSNKKVPCRILTFENESDIVRAIILFNSQRKKSIFDERNEIAILTEIYKKEKKKNLVQGRLRDYIAEKIGISPTELQWYWDVSKLDNKILSALQTERINKSVAREFSSGLSKEDQVEVYNELVRKNALNVKNIRALKKAINKGVAFDRLDENFEIVTENVESSLAPAESDVDENIDNTDITAGYNNAVESDNNDLGNESYGDTVEADHNETIEAEQGNTADIDISIAEVDDSEIVTTDDADITIADSNDTTKALTADEKTEISEPENNEVTTEITDNEITVETNHDDNFKESIETEYTTDGASLDNTSASAAGPKFWIRNIQTRIDIIAQNEKEEVNEENKKALREQINIGNSLLEFLKCSLDFVKSKSDEN